MTRLILEQQSWRKRGCFNEIYRISWTCTAGLSKLFLHFKAHTEGEWAFLNPEPKKNLSGEYCLIFNSWTGQLEIDRKGGWCTAKEKTALIKFYRSPTGPQELLNIADRSAQVTKPLGKIRVVWALMKRKNIRTLGYCLVGMRTRSLSLRFLVANRSRYVSFSGSFLISPFWIFSISAKQENRLISMCHLQIKWPTSYSHCNAFQICQNWRHLVAAIQNKDHSSCAIDNTHLTACV